MFPVSELYPKPESPHGPIINFVGHWQLTFMDPGTKLVFRRALQAENGRYLVLKSETKEAQLRAEELLDMQCPGWRG